MLVQHFRMHADEQVIWGSFAVTRPGDSVTDEQASITPSGFVVEGGALYLYRRGEEWAHVSMGKTKDRYRAPVLLRVEAPGTWTGVTMHEEAAPHPRTA
ncbi:hypothetical protein TPB0596_31110 [Tsukamurella pulmonis]|nr:hypothetical protein TPB0596_31110 [Tsukamurella pulmonis]